MYDVSMYEKCIHKISFGCHGFTSISPLSGAAFGFQPEGRGRDFVRNTNFSGIWNNSQEKGSKLKKKGTIKKKGTKLKKKEQN